jgi:16S rRNA (guanine(966)-N(2))-methyltransferase RsmD
MSDGIRVIAGELRGRIIKTPRGEFAVRPMLSRIKKSLFDILTPVIADAKMLDLYAGIGGVGIEALSRQAAQVTFVELDTSFKKIIEENLRALGLDKKAVVHQADVMHALQWLKGPFDIIFMGPPYKDAQKTPLALTTPTLKGVAASGMLADGGLIISQRATKEPVAVPEQFMLARTKVYDDTTIDFYKKKQANGEFREY